jgi:type IV secretion system protein VirB5
MADDNQNHLVSQVTAGQIESSDVAVQNVTITSMSEEMVQGARIARGTALMTVDRFYSAQNSREPRTEHWMLSITYYLNPKQVSDQSRIYPQYEFINPLGLTITEFHENRVSVDPLSRMQLQERQNELRTDSAVLSRGIARAAARPVDLRSDD